MNPLLLTFDETITTERLLMRPPRAGDGAMVYEAVAESLAELKPWMPWAQDESTPDDSETYARTAAANFVTREELSLLIFHRESGRYLGGTGYHTIDWQVPKLEIGYWLRTSETGKGYITEAVNALTRFAIQTFGAKRLDIRCDADNIASARVAERCGYVLEGRLRHNRRNTSGEWTDTLIYGFCPTE